MFGCGDRDSYDEPLNASFCASASNTSGWLCTLGIKPIETDRRIAFAIRRWFTPLSPVSFLCFILPT